MGLWWVPEVEQVQGTALGVGGPRWNLTAAERPKVLSDTSSWMLKAPGDIRTGVEKQGLRWESGGSRTVTWGGCTGYPLRRKVVNKPDTVTTFLPCSAAANSLTLPAHLSTVLHNPQRQAVPHPCGSLESLTLKRAPECAVLSPPDPLFGTLLSSSHLGKNPMRCDRKIQ